MKKLKLMGTVLALSLLISGCIPNDKENIQESQTIKQEAEIISLKVWGGEPDQEFIAQMVESFKEEYKDKAKFDITIEAANEGDCKKMILENINEAPDVFSFPDDQLLELAASGILEPHSLPEEIVEKNVEGAVNAASINKQIYAYPLTADNGYFMFYNKKYFKEEDLGSLESILEVASINNKKLTFDLSNSWYFYSFFGNTGLTLGLNDDGLTNHCDWNSTTQEIKGVDVGNAVLNISRNPGFLNGGDEVLKNGAADGSVIAGVSGVWSADALQELWGDDFAATKLPTYQCAGKDIQMGSYTGYKLLGVNAYSENKEWADKLAIWMSNAENQLLRFKVRGSGPSNKEIAESKEVQESPQIKALIMQSEYGSLQRVGGKYWGAVEEFANRLISGELSASNMQSAMDEMVKSIEMDVVE